MDSRCGLQELQNNPDPLSGWIA